MVNARTNLRNLAFLLVFLISLPGNALSASSPKSFQAVLNKLKLDEAILTNLDDELKVPNDWIEKAKAEGKVRLYSTFDQQQTTALFAPFRERYPFIQVENTFGTREARVVRPLIAYERGKILADILTALGGAFYRYQKADAVTDLQGLPALKNVFEGAKDPKGQWVSISASYWCMTYNTKLVKKDELPRKWEDLLTNPRWKGKNLALGNRPNLWVQQLWMKKGENWTKDFLTRLFTEVKPQLRKEGLSALAQLVAAGEFHAFIPGSGPVAQQMASNGAPLAFTCPEPVPASASDEAIILKGSPNINAAKILVNWLLSKEGQITQYAASGEVPVHKELARPEFVPFADQILGKDTSFRDMKFETEVFPAVEKLWNNFWIGGGGAPRSS
jgi:iron(III) transport system substrate-binding protein